MKKSWVMIGVMFVTLSILSKESTTETFLKDNKNTEIQSSDGAKLVAKSDCMACHKSDKKLIGPSFLDIAKKYPTNDKNINYLVDKIIKGGSGVWGKMPMAAHTILRREDAKLMVKYILSLKKE